jgi:hypothetical protein
VDEENAAAQVEHANHLDGLAFPVEVQQTAPDEEIETARAQAGQSGLADFRCDAAARGYGLG